MSNNMFTESARAPIDEVINEAVAISGIQPTIQQKVPKQVAEAPETVVKEKASEATGKKLTREEYQQFLSGLSNEQMQDFAARVMVATQQLNAQKQEPTKDRYITDFSNIGEESIFDLSVPIKVIDHTMPDFLDVKLKDKNFVARWIHTGQRRMGQARAQGWTYVTREDLETDLLVEITTDVAGHFIYTDVVLMKLTKNKYYGALRANFQRALNMAGNSNRLHKNMQDAIENEIEKAGFGEDYRHYKDKNAMSTYAPLG